MPPMKLLAELAEASLPRAIDDLDDIEKIRVLQANGDVQASIPPWRFGSPQQPATVYAVTEHGLKALGKRSAPASSLIRAGCKAIRSNDLLVRSK